MRAMCYVIVDNASKNISIEISFLSEYILILKRTKNIHASIEQNFFSFFFFKKILYNRRTCLVDMFRFNFGSNADQIIFLFVIIRFKFYSCLRNIY